MKIPKARKLRSGAWFIQLRLGGESIPIKAYTEKECVRQAQLTKAEYQAGKREPKQTRTRLTLREAIDNYIAKRDAVLSPSTIRGYRVIQRTRFLAIMDRCVSGITAGDWQAACNAEAKKCSAKTLKNAWGLIASVIADATDCSAPKVTLPQIVPNERPFLEPEQIGTFISALRGDPVEIPALLALSSLRRSEILALGWDDVNLKKRIIYVHGAAVVDIDNNLIYKQTNKNTSSTRIVPIIIPQLYIALLEQKKDSGLVVTCSPNSIWRQVNKVCRQNNLPLVGVHGLRHSFASLAYHLNVPKKISMEIGGWSDDRTMQKIYTHIARQDVSNQIEHFKGFFKKIAN